MESRIQLFEDRWERNEAYGLEKTEGIVLRAIDYGETNKIVTLLTAKYGKIAVLAKGANKPQSRFFSVCQPFVHGQWLVYGGNSGMFSASQAEVLDSFRAIREDLYLSAYAVCMAELADLIFVEREPIPGSFPLLLHMFRHLVAGKDPDILLRIFESKMWFAAGIQPNLTECAHCGNRLDVAVRFSIRLAGPLCQPCHEADPIAIWMKPATHKLLRLFQIVDIARLGQVKVGEDVKLQLDKIHRQYLEEQGGISLKSRQFLDQLNKYGLHH